MESVVALRKESYAAIPPFEGLLIKAHAMAFPLASGNLAAGVGIKVILPPACPGRSANLFRLTDSTGPFWNRIGAKYLWQVTLMALAEAKSITTSTAGTMRAPKEGPVLYQLFLHKDVPTKRLWAFMAALQGIRKEYKAPKSSTALGSLLMGWDLAGD